VPLGSLTGVVSVASSLAMAVSLVLGLGLEFYV
jgi:hypothetical protein